MPLKLTYKGFNYVDYYNGEYSDNDTLPGVAATHANAVALTPDYGIDVADSTIYAGGATTDSVADLTTAIQEANANGMTSFVRPLIDFLYPQASSAYPGNYYVTDGDSASNPNGYNAKDVPTGVTPATVPASAYSNGDTVNYRGELSPLDLNLPKFFGSPTQAGSYDDMIVNEAKAAQAAGAQLFSIGTELDSLATDTNASVEADWTNLIADVRAVFTGKLTYSANWSTANQVTFWNKLDLVGIDGYVPLSNATINSAADNPSEASLEAGWTTVSNVKIAYSGGVTVGQQLGGLSAVDYFDELAQSSIDKQFIFSEFGYQNDVSAAADPTGGSNRGITDPSLQAELYQSFFDAWGGEQQTANANGGMIDGHPFSLVGAYIWNWNPDTSAGGYDDWSPNGYPAASVITAGYASSGPSVVAEKNVAGVAGYEGEPTSAHGTAGTSGTGVLAGDSDPAGGTLSVTAVTGGTIGTAFNTTYGSLTLNADGSYTYFPSGPVSSAPTGAPASDVITFTVTDTAGNSTTSTLTISDYRNPVAVAFSAGVNAGQTATGTAGTSGTGLLAGDSDPDGVAISIGSVYSAAQMSSLSGPTNPNVGAYGTLTVNANGAYSYVALGGVELAAASAANKGAALTDNFTTFVLPSAPVASYGIEGVTFTVTSPAALSDTVANIVANLTGLEQDAPYFTSLTATNGTVNVAVATFSADQSALDKIVGRFGVTDTAANISNSQAALSADHHISSLTTVNSSGKIVAQSQYNTDGSLYLAYTVTTESNSDIDYHYAGGSFFTGKSFTAFDNVTDSSGHLLLQMQYNGSTLIQQTSYNADGSVYEQVNVQYLSNGEVIDHYVSGSYFNGKPYTAFDLVYNGSTLVSQTLYNGTMPTQITVYNADGSTYEQATVSKLSNGNLDYHYAGGSFFNGKSFAAFDNITSASGLLLSQTLYNSSGKPTQTIQFNANGSIYLEDTVSTLANGNIDYHYQNGSFFTGKAFAAFDNVTNSSGVLLTQTQYDTTKFAIQQTQFNTNGSVYLQEDASKPASGQVLYNYNAGSYFNAQAYSSFTNLATTGGTLLDQELFNKDGSHTFTVPGSSLTLTAAKNDTFNVTGGNDTTRFNATGFGADLFKGYAAGDVFSFSTSIFANYTVLSQHLSGTTSAVITDAANDTLTLNGVSRASVNSTMFTFS